MDIQKLIKESIRKVLSEKVYGKIATVFHSSRAKPEDFIPLLVSGNFHPGGGAGAMYGPGLYTVFQLKGSKTANFGYGDNIYKLKLNLDGFLVLSVEICKKVYGRSLSLKDQLLVSGNQRAIQEYEANDYLSTLINLPLENLEEYSHIGVYDLDLSRVPESEQKEYIQKSKEKSIKRYGFIIPRTAPFALQLVDNKMWELLPGIIYTGDNDGLCALIYDGNAATPLAYTKKEDVLLPKEKNPLVTAVFGVDSESSREEKDFNWTKLSKEQIKTAVGRVYKKGNTRYLTKAVAKPGKTTHQTLSYNDIKKIFNFPLMNHMQNRLNMMMTIEERIEYILKTYPGIIFSIKALPPGARLQIVKSSILSSSQARTAGVDTALSADNITHMAKIFDIHSDPNNMLDLADFLLDTNPGEASIVIQQSAIPSKLDYFPLYLIKFIEKRIMRIWRLQVSGTRYQRKISHSERRARREANYLGIRGVEIPSYLMGFIGSDPKKYYPNTFNFYTKNKELILSQTNNSSDYSFEMFKIYSGYPYAFKQFIYETLLRKDPKIIEHQKEEPDAFNEKKVNFLKKQD